MARQYLTIEDLTEVRDEQVYDLIKVEKAIKRKEKELQDLKDERAELARKTMSFLTQKGADGIVRGGVLVYLQLASCGAPSLRQVMEKVKGIPEEVRVKITNMYQKLLEERESKMTVRVNLNYKNLL